jgi:hypothetical protein
VGRAVLTAPGRPARAGWRRLQRFGAWGVLDQAVLASSGLVVAVLVARSGGPAGLGAFALVQAVLLMLAGVLKAGFGDPAVLAARGDGDRSLLPVARPLVAMLGVAGVALAAGWWLGAGLLEVARPRPVGLLLAAAVPFAAFTEPGRAFRIAAMDERAVFLGDLGVAAARVGGAGLGLAAGLDGVELGLAGLALGGLAAVASVQRALRDGCTAAQVLAAWRVGRWLVAEGLLYNLCVFGVWMAAGPRAGLGVVGELRAGQQLFAPVQTLLVGINTLLFGRLAETRGRLVGAARPLVAVEVAVIGAWGILLVGAGPAAAGLVFGDGFRLGHGELAVLAMAAVVACGFELTALQLRAALLMRPLLVARAGCAAVALAGAATFGSSLATVAAVLLASQLVAAGLGLRAWRRTRPTVRR